MNLFPKISGKHTDFLAQMRRMRERGLLSDTVRVEGTVKLHGMHADILFDLHDTSNIRFQSRNRVCSPDEWQHGWPWEISRKTDALVLLKTQLLETYQASNPDTNIDPTHPIVVAGEWIGGDVQQNIGTSQLSTRFVILSVSINGMWQNDSQYSHVSIENSGIYNIFACGSKILQFDTTNITEHNPILFEMQSLADAVEKNCPFAARFGIKNGRGEGIVWKIGTPEGRADPKCWLKTKGPILGKENRIDARAISINQSRKLNLTEAMTRWISPRRVQQGFEYLLDMDFYPTHASLKHYMMWITKDVIDEEGSEIRAVMKKSGVSEKMVKTKIEYAARSAYLDEMKNCGIYLAWAACYEKPRARSGLEDEFC